MQSVPHGPALCNGVRQACSSCCNWLARARAGDPKSGDLMTKAQDEWYAAGGPDADKRVANVLNGLGFQQEQWSKSCAEFSGGWQVRGLALLAAGHACVRLAVTCCVRLAVTC